MPKLSIIIPCYYNEENIPVTSAELLENEKLFPKDVSFEYVMVDDGSKDNTWEELVKFREHNPDKVKIIKLAGNVGSYNAILAGMKYATGDCTVIISADLQDPPELMVTMYDYWQKGIKFVVANRQDRQESWSQKLFSNTYHNLIRKFALKTIPPGGFDYVLFDRQLRDEVVKIDEKNTNTIYLLAWLNYDFISIPYVRKKREIGVSRWTLSKKIKLFVDSFVAFSFAPIRAISITGVILGAIAFLYGLFVILAKMTGAVPIEGWTSLMVVFLFVSSFQMIALGIIGEYVWRTLDASRKRPNYVVEKVF
ncbi:dolichol-phosphate mannosyltransferase [Pseudarcicella hirudinis]|uniref:Dolichol-phosphate mannosyltransferase n=1 Tax=Pseudarcicella hirudinis TaxID=1079859 RepID=A0A1I5XCW5_9BACT|nr:glycosyltransferase family 2 protein [Pseudarcicella hirudinis]SFQ29487.1 dolichol-phosphate mannosyltransferase [Pseudarcicella hirudinis]